MTRQSEDVREWAIPSAVQRDAERLDAPVDVPGWSERPWVELRPLTDEEMLRRESLGVYEEYDAPLVDPELHNARLPERQPVIRRRYDLWAMAEFDYRHCVVDFCLPVAAEDGSYRQAKPTGGPEADLSLFRRLPPRLATWLAEAIQRVNRRLATEVELLGLAKKS